MNDRIADRHSPDRLLMPVLAGFFIMGFCDIVAPISGRIAAEASPAQQGAVSFLPTMVFLWFLLLSGPVARAMNRWGRKRTALAGYALTAAGLLVPYLAGADARLGWYFAGFALLGVGNTVVQVAVNPLLASIAPAGRMTSYLTVGQIFRNASLLLVAPIVTLLVAWTGSWRLLLPLYAGLTFAGGIWLWLTPASEPAAPAPEDPVGGLRLMRHRAVLLSVAGIAAFIAADVGIGFLSVRLIDSPDSILTTTGFYACRIVGTLAGAWLLVRISDLKYLAWNMAAALGLCALLFVTHDEVLIYGALGLLGFALSCVFATFFAVATRAMPAHANGVAGLSVMAISAGALSGPVCGALIRLSGDARHGMLFVAACLLYMLWAAIRLRRDPQSRNPKK